MLTLEMKHYTQSSVPQLKIFHYPVYSFKRVGRVTVELASSYILVVHAWSIMVPEDLMPQLLDYVSEE